MVIYTCLHQNRYKEKGQYAENPRSNYTAYSSFEYNYPNKLDGK